VGYSPAELSKLVDSWRNPPPPPFEPPQTYDEMARLVQSWRSLGKVYDPRETRDPQGRWTSGDTRLDRNVVRAIKGPRSEVIRHAHEDLVTANQEAQKARRESGETSGDYVEAALDVKEAEKELHDRWDQRDREIGPTTRATADTAHLNPRPHPVLQTATAPPRSDQETQEAAQAIRQWHERQQQQPRPQQEAVSPAVQQERAQQARHREESYWLSREGQDRRLTERERLDAATAAATAAESQTGEDEPPHVYFKPKRFRTAVFNTASKVSDIATSASSLLHNVASLANARDIWTIARKVNNIVAHVLELKGHLDEAPAEFKELGDASKVKLQNARDHLRNMKDNIERLKAQNQGDDKTARNAQERTKRRKERMASRRAERPEDWEPPTPEPRRV
jgi:hypothetical protein